MKYWKETLRKITKNTLAFVKVKLGIIGLAPADGCIAGERTKFKFYPTIAVKENCA